MDTIKKLLLIDEGGGPVFLIQDEFHTALTAGNVNGTSAEPGPGTRTVVDTTNELAIVGGQCRISGHNANGDPGTWITAVSRAAGTAALYKYQRNTDITFDSTCGFDSNQSGAMLVSFPYFYIRETGTFVYPSNANISTILSADTWYELVIVLRATGAFFLIKGGAITNWTLFWVESTSNAASLYPALTSYSETLNWFGLDYLRVAQLGSPWTSTYGPATNAAVFTGANGTALSALTNAVGGAWTGATADVQTNAARISPTAGADLLASLNGDFANWTGDDPDDWTLTVAEAGTSEITESAGGEECRFIYAAVDNIPLGITQTVLTSGNWYSTDLDIADSTTGAIKIYWGTTAQKFTDISGVGSKVYTRRADATTFIIYRNDGAANADITIDNVSVKALTLSTLFASVDASENDVIVQADATLTAGTQAGVVVCLDSAASPANFLIGYHDGTNAILEKCVAGTYTTLISTAAAYSAGKTIVVIKDGTSVDLFYNNVKIGTTQTVSDAGIISNTLHGLFSTHADNRLDNFQCYPRDITGAAKTELDLYSQD